MSFNASRPASKQVRTRILGRVLSSISVGDNHMNAETLVNDTRPFKRSTNSDLKCLSVIVIMDIIDNKGLQLSLILTIRQYALTNAKTGNTIIE